MRIYILFLVLSFSLKGNAQLKWVNVDSLYQPLPSSVHVYFTNEPIDTARFRAYYLIADLKDKEIDFTVDTTLGRRFTPTQFYQKNDQPLVVLNCTFFSFATNRNLTTVIKDGKLVGFNAPVKGVGKDSINMYYYFKSAIGIFKNRKADIAWMLTDSAARYPVGYQFPVERFEWGKIEPNLFFTYNDSIYNFSRVEQKRITDHKWKAITAVGGGPVLVQNNIIMITNEEERMFTGKAINDKHPRTAMGYTTDGKLIILMIEGRNTVAHGATLGQEAQILKDLGCWEAINLDGGGSSCMLVNGKETIKPSDATGQRAVPAVFMILTRSKATK